MITFTGTHVSRDFGAPSVYDLSVQLMRLCRFGGGGQTFWPVGLHSMLVADLLPPELEHHGLLHDAAEIAVGDVCRPFKTDAAREVERTVTERIYAHLGLAKPTPKEAVLIHVADMRAVNAEGSTICGPRGYPEVQPNFSPDQEAIAALRYYLDGYAPMDAIMPDGKWPKEYERRLRAAITRAQHSPAYVEQYTGRG